jgi:hypothetical protein
MKTIILAIVIGGMFILAMGLYCENQHLKTAPQEIMTVPFGPCELQEFLKEQGYYQGPIDGKLGKLSREAYENWYCDYMAENISSSDSLASGRGFED